MSASRTWTTPTTCGNRASRLHDPFVVHDRAPDDGGERAGAFEVLVGDREAVAVEDREVGVVAHLDRTEVVFADEPLVGRRGEPEHFLTRERLIAQDWLAGEVPA